MSMKYLLATAAVVLFVSTVAMAGSEAPAIAGQSAGQFVAQKTETLKNISERIAAMQKQQSCVQAASTNDAIRACFVATTQQAVAPPTGGKPGTPDPAASKPTH